MDRRFAVTILAVLLVTAGSAALAGNLSQDSQTAPLGETVSGVQREDAPETAGTQAAEPDYAYILKEYEGRVAVFTAANPDTPVEVLNTLVKYLPDYDRSQLREGIKISDYSALVALIEDYVS